MMMMSSDIARVQVRHWVLVALAAGVALAVGTPGPGGVLLGGGMMGLSLALYTALFAMAVRGGRRRLAIGLLFAKLAAFLGLGWLAFASGSVRPDPLGFAFGVTCCPAAVVWEAVRGRKV
jgi:hypothetical protein